MKELTAEQILKEYISPNFLVAEGAWLYDPIIAAMQAYKNQGSGQALHSAAIHAVNTFWTGDGWQRGFSPEEIKALNALREAVKQCQPQLNGEKIECAIKVGMIIQYMTNDNWDRLGHKDMVRAYSIPDDKVLLGQQVISISGFLENVESGRYKIVDDAYPNTNPCT